MNLSEKAERFRRLHKAPPILRLANVWDAASARIVEEAGLPAVATSSAGIAFSLGYPDGEVIPRAEMLQQVQRIARVVSVPVNADLEAGYGDVEGTAAGLIAAGAVGLNLEDAKAGVLEEIPAQAQKIEAIRMVGRTLGVPIVINARTDVYLWQVGEPGTRFDRTVERLIAYREAGADCAFVPGVTDEETIGRLARTIGFPLNILGVQGAPSVNRMEELGVSRVSLGSGPMRATMARMRRLTEEFRDSGTYSVMLEESISYVDAWSLMNSNKSG
jgi:2-methylisocitrate lyase-like PEP mutase family enzyme